MHKGIAPESNKIDSLRSLACTLAFSRQPTIAAITKHDRPDTWVAEYESSHPAAAPYAGHRTPLAMIDSSIRLSGCRLRSTHVTVDRRFQPSMKSSTTQLIVRESDNGRKRV
jgi:hypothetical protein